MSTFQAAFLNEVIYVTHARFKESKKGCSLPSQPSTYRLHRADASHIHQRVHRAL